MGKGKPKLRRHGRRGGHIDDDEDESPLPSSVFDASIAPATADLPSSPPQQARHRSYHISEGPSKYELYQASVQAPKGDISYLQKFFHLYVGGRSPIHLREDFCGTALLCAEWLRGGVQRLATGLDLDVDALKWGLSTNFKKVGGDACNRVCLLHGDVLHPVSTAKLVSAHADATKNPTAVVNLDEGQGVISRIHESSSGMGPGETDTIIPTEDVALRKCQITADSQLNDEVDICSMWPNFDIICAFNYSCCCLHNRAELLVYFSHVFGALSVNGGIFAMDLYGGVSSEVPLKLRRRFPEFTYIWEQEAFDVINRMTKISLHYQLRERTIRHAFTYHWRLWSLAEVQDCLKDAGFTSVHFWLRTMGCLKEEEENEDSGDNDCKYEEATVFYQQSAWNAYIVAVAPCRKHVS